MFLVTSVFQAKLCRQTLYLVFHSGLSGQDQACDAGHSRVLMKLVMQRYLDLFKCRHLCLLVFN